MRNLQENNSSSNGPKMKKRRLPGACDVCRKKRVKCDSAEMLDGVCSNCKSSQVPCTHETPYKRQEVEAHIASLEQRNRALESALAKIQALHPETDLLAEVNVTSPPQKLSQSSASTPTTNVNSIYPVNPLSLMNSPPPPSEDESSSEESHSGILDLMKTEDADAQFWGASSHFALMSQAFALKKEYAQTTPEEPHQPQPDSEIGDHKFRREAFWEPHMWEKLMFQEEPESKLPFQFPPPDLLSSFVSLYFRHINSCMAIFHRPTLEQQIREGKHYKDPSFARLVLAICAVGSRHSKDPRVFVNGSSMSAGNHFFSQVRFFHARFFFDLLPLVDVQTICVSISYIFGLSAPRGTWSLCGFGLRACQERGIHKRVISGGKKSQTVEDELWKRAFWMLVILDRQISSFAGRPSAISSEDIEVDFPEECDDEYWQINPETQEVSFHHPPGKPSVLACFIVALRLCELYAVSHRTLYASPRARALFGVSGDDWEKKVVVELDSSLNIWLDSLPAHLRWDPNNEDPIFFDQSCLLYIVYYGLQIQIHRPFLNRKNSPLTFPSLAICTNSARACSHILDAQVKRGSLYMPPAVIVANLSAYVLLVTIYGAKRFGASLNPMNELRCIRMLQGYLSQCERVFVVAGRLNDMINETAEDGFSAHQVPVSTAKRTHHEMEQGTLNSPPMHSETNDIGIDSPLNDQALAALVGHSRVSTSKPPSPHSSAPRVQQPQVAKPFVAQDMSFPSDPTDQAFQSWNPNPYTFPSSTSVPNADATNMYPTFRIDPSLPPGGFSFEDLERLSAQMAAISPDELNWDTVLGADTDAFVSTM